jgi:hypothetical protein
VEFWVIATDAHIFAELTFNARLNHSTVMVKMVMEFLMNTNLQIYELSSVPLVRKLLARKIIVMLRLPLWLVHSQSPLYLIVGWIDERWQLIIKLQVITLKCFIHLCKSIQ